VKATRIVLSDAAVADILAQANWYDLQSGQKLAMRWERAVTSTTLRLATMPHAGIPCTFGAEALRGMRRMPVNGFPAHLIFYQLVGSRSLSCASFTGHET
jgi:plasmid stabilization system protein ParE